MFRSQDLLHRALDCGYAITDELFKLAGGGGDNMQRAATTIVSERCSQIERSNIQLQRVGSEARPQRDSVRATNRRCGKETKG